MLRSLFRGEEKIQPDLLCCEQLLPCSEVFELLCMCALLFIQQLFSANTCLHLKHCAAKMSRIWGHCSSVCAMSAFCAGVSLVGFCAGADASHHAWSWAGSGAPAGLCVCFCCNSVSDSEKTFEMFLEVLKRLWRKPPTHTYIEIYM